MNLSSERDQSFRLRRGSLPTSCLPSGQRSPIAASSRLPCASMKRNRFLPITLDGYAASHLAVAKLKAAGTLPRRVRIRSCKYLNNVIEQDHRRIKQRIRPMLGFKRFKTAAVTIRGIESAAKIKKDQFNLRPLTGKPATAPELWAAVLAA